MARYERAAAQARQEGTVLLGGTRLRGGVFDHGHFVAPTVARLPLASSLFREELFVPILAIGEVDGLLIMKNPIDRALKWYPIMSYGRLRSGPQALGYTGLPGMGRLGEDAVKVEHYNVSGIVGHEHDAMLYLSSSCIIERMAPYVFVTAETELASQAEEREVETSSSTAQAAP